MNLIHFVFLIVFSIHTTLFLLHQEISLIPYFVLSISFNSIALLIEAKTALLSLSGTIADESPRKSIPYYVSSLIIIIIQDLAVRTSGYTYLWNFCQHLWICALVHPTHGFSSCVGSENHHSAIHCRPPHLACALFPLVSEISTRWSYRSRSPFHVGAKNTIHGIKIKLTRVSYLWWSAVPWIPPK